MSLTLIKVVECEQIPLKTFLKAERPPNLTLGSPMESLTLDKDDATTPISPTLSIKLVLKEAVLK